MPDVRRFVLALACLGLGATSSSAQALFGTFSWQMQPYCNSVQLTLISLPTGFTVEGTDDQCGGADKGSAIGTAAFNASGTLVIGFTIGLPTSKSAQVSAFVNPATGDGTWTDSHGNAGTFKFFGAQAGLPPRPDGDVYFRAAGLSTAQSGFNVIFTSVSHNHGGGGYDAATGVYTVPATGVYSIAYSVGYVPGPATNYRACAFITVTGIAIERASCIPNVAGSTFLSLTGASVLPLSAGNTIRVQANAGAGATLTSSGSGLTIVKLR